MSREHTLRKQPSVEELKNTNIFLEYIARQEPISDGLRRIDSYFTSLQNRPGEIYWGFSFRRPIKKENLEKWSEEEKILDLTIPAEIPFDKDIFYNEFGDILFLDPEKPQESKYIFQKVANFKELNYWYNKFNSKPYPYHTLPSNNEF